MSTPPGPAAAQQISAQTFLELFPFDEALYSLEGEELDFMKTQTGIEDEDELKTHIIAITREAYAVFPFPCIRRFAHIGLRLSRLPGYDRLIQLGKEREGAILLDIGCCFGNDVRNVAADGFPVKQIVTSDLHEVLDVRTQTLPFYSGVFPAKFLPGDAFDPMHLAVAPPVYVVQPKPLPDLASLTSLNQLRGHVAAVHAFAFFHLFNEDQQEHLAHALGGLLSPMPGSLLIGCHRGAPVKGVSTETAGKGDSSEGESMKVFCHSPESWTELSDGKVFNRGTVKVETNLVQFPVGVRGEQVYFLEWCVTRL